MTKEEAIKEFRDSVDNKKKWSMFEYCYEELICDIYSDFESRTCENCEHYQEKVIDYDDITYDGNCNNNALDIIYTTKDFGCNLFESKDKNEMQ